MEALRVVPPGHEVARTNREWRITVAWPQYFVVAVASNGIE